MRKCKNVNMRLIVILYNPNSNNLDTKNSDLKKLVAHNSWFIPQLTQLKNQHKELFLD